MNHLVKSILPAIVATAIGVGFITQVHAAATGNVSAQVNLTGELAILSYYSDLKITLPLTELAPGAPCVGDTANDFHCENSTLRTRTATQTGGELRANFAPNAGLGIPNFPVLLIAAPLRLDNVWAVRTIGGGGFFSGSSTLTMAMLNGGAPLINGSSQLGISSVLFALRSAGATGSGTPALFFADPGLVNPRVGGVQFTLNFTNTTSAGLHTRAGAEYRLTLTNI